MPWHRLKLPLDIGALYPFGCLVIVHRAKEQCADGYLDQRGEPGAFVGWAWQDGVKGIAVCMPDYRVIHCVFYKADVSYFPWRPDGQRRLHGDGTFGDEGETARVFSEIPEPFDFNQLLDIFEPNHVAGGDEGVGNSTKDDAEDGAEVSSPKEVAEEATSDMEDVAEPSQVHEELPQIQRELQRGARICFGFNEGHACGTYVGPSNRRQDAGQNLHRVHWDDGDKRLLVNLSEERRFDGDNVADMEAGDWAIVGFFAKHISSGGAFQSDAYVEAMVFARDYSDAKGLLVPMMAAKQADADNGPFTYQQAVRRADWPDFEAAGEVELETLEDNNTWELVDEHVALNEGAYIYDTRWVFTRKRATPPAKIGPAKGRLVLRGDQQTFDEFEDEPEAEYGTIPEGDPAPERAPNEPARAAVGGEEPEIQSEEPVANPAVNCRNSASNCSYSQKHHFSDPSGVLGSSGEEGSNALLLTAAALCTAYKSLFAVPFAMVNQRVANTYRQLHSPVMACTVMFILLALAVSNGEHIFIADVKGAFLYAWLLPEEIVYCRPPKGYEDHPRFRGKIMRLRKALYGLKQAPRRWFDHLVTVLARHGMQRTAIDPCLFVMMTAAFVVKAGTHVDDFIFTTNDVEKFTAWFHQITLELKISSNEEITTAGSDYMSLIISYNIARGMLKLSQRGYIEKAIKAFGFENLKPSSTPIAQGMKFTKEDMPADVDEERKSSYLRMIGVARWVARNALPEATFAVAYLSCFMASPSKGMMTALVRVFRYFKWAVLNDVDQVCFDSNTVKRGHVPPGFNCRVGKNQVYGYVDATFLSEERTECRYGALFFINAILICVISKKLPDPVLSSTQAEYYALVICACEGKFIRMVLEALGEMQTGPMLIAQDNKSCIQIVENPGARRGHTKHFENRIRWIEKAVADGAIALVYVNTNLMVADVVTKALGYDAFARHASYMKGLVFPDLKECARKRKKVTFEEEE